MYMRFVTPLIHPQSRVEAGFFRASWHVLKVNPAPWLSSELEAQMDWFNANLPIPRRIAHHFKSRDSLYGVCWFRDTARECIERARYCGWLLNEGGLPVEVIQMSDAREVIWRDDHQIVVPARSRMPRAFAGRR